MNPFFFFFHAITPYRSIEEKEGKSVEWTFANEKAAMTCLRQTMSTGNYGLITSMFMDIDRCCFEVTVCHKTVE